MLLLLKKLMMEIIKNLGNYLKKVYLKIIVIKIVKMIIVILEELKINNDIKYVDLIIKDFIYFCINYFIIFIYKFQIFIMNKNKI